MTKLVGINQGKENLSIFLRGIMRQDLSNILDFIYLGEVNIEEDRLASFISIYI